MTVPTTHKTFNSHNNNKNRKKKKKLLLFFLLYILVFFFVVLFTATAADAVFIVGHIIRYMHRIYLYTSVNFKHNCKYRISYLNSF